MYNYNARTHVLYGYHLYLMINYVIYICILIQTFTNTHSFYLSFRKIFPIKDNTIDAKYLDRDLPKIILVENI